MFIYKITHLESGRAYVGQTTREPVIRWYEHKYELKNHTHGNRYLQAAWDKYGADAFAFEVIKTCNSLDELNREEIELINNFNNLFNLSKGGKAHLLDLTQRNKISHSQKIPIIGMCIKTGELREYISAKDAAEDGFSEKSIRKCASAYVIRSKNRKYKMSSNSHKGWVWIDKANFTLEKLRDRVELAKTGKVRNERPVVGLSIFTEEFIYFKSAKDTSRDGFTPVTVGRSCQGRVKVHGGFFWSYNDIDNPQSLLVERKKTYLSNPPLTGPKRWQY